MKIVVGYPPIIDKIAAKFPQAKKPNVLFSWGDTIFNPSGNHISVPLMEHEGVHGERQNGNPETWWDQYLTNDTFRLVEELAAHRAEYAAFSRMAKDRNALAGYLNFVASRLASPLYGNMISVKEARKEITSGKS